MFRCVVAVALAATAIGAAAQEQRSFPSNALRGELYVTQPPEALLNGHPARLAPGARIRGQNNMIVMSGQAVGQKLVVHYTLDSLGLIKDVWILRRDELSKNPWPRTLVEAKTWAFDPVAQVWSKP